MKYGGEAMKKIVLFDMDGTLTPPRKSMEFSIAAGLAKLQASGFEIGILTGSDMDYLRQQCSIMFDISPVDYTKVHYLPCNGTKYYTFKPGTYAPKCVYEKNMKEEIGEQKWKTLISSLLNLQASISSLYDIPQTGHFVNYRGSTLNWCPIGRQATHEERKTWIELDQKYQIRKMFLPIVETSLESLELESVVVKYGGDTSFDIYPAGWDKTFAFKNFAEYDDIYFVGDRCERSGNDYEAYVLAGEKGYKTTGPSETKEIIKKILNR